MVVCVDGKLPSIKVRLKILYPVDDSKGFSFSYALVLLSGVKTASTIGNDYLSLVLLLAKDHANALVAGIHKQVKG